MFYGLNKFIKNLLPKRLFYRALLIVAIPVIVLQLIITIVFFDSLWIKTNKGMTRALVNEIQTFIEVYSNDQYDKNEIKNIFSVYQDLNIEFIQDENFVYDYNERWFSPVDRTLRRELKSNFGNKDFWKHIFATPGVPIWLLPIMIPVEIIGLLSRWFTLLLPYTANFVLFFKYLTDE